MCLCNTSKDGKKAKVHLKKATESIQKELDIVNFVRMQKQMRILMSLLLDKEERSLIEFNKRFVVDSRSDSSDSLYPEKSSERIQKSINMIQGAAEVRSN